MKPTRIRIRKVKGVKGRSSICPLREMLDKEIRRQTRAYFEKAAWFTIDPAEYVRVMTPEESDFFHAKLQTYRQVKEE